MAKDDNPDETESMAQLYGHLLGLRISFLAFVISSTSEEEIKQYAELLIMIKDLGPQDMHVENSDPTNKIIIEEAKRTIMKVHTSLMTYISERESEDEH
ncbi:MAG: hypothetical protein OXF76_10240 [Caldilineaceae bacterium]|nr:hypothetical protein [Caldilineaceae bacterium]